MAGVRLVFTKAFMVTVLLTLLLNIGVKPAEGQFSACSFSSRPHPRGICGSDLADLRAFICSRRNQPAMVKRDAETGWLLPETMVKRNAQTDLDDPLRNIKLSSESALTYLTKRQRTTNLVCECCYNVCTVDVFYEYCY